MMTYKPSRFGGEQKSRHQPVEDNIEDNRTLLTQAVKVRQESRTL